LPFNFIGRAKKTLSQLYTIIKTERKKPKRTTSISKRLYQDPIPNVFFLSSITWMKNP